MTSEGRDLPHRLTRPDVSTKTILPASATADLRVDHVHHLVVPGLYYVDLCLLDVEGNPHASAWCELGVAGRTESGMTDADGRISLRVTAAATEQPAQLRVDGSEAGWGDANPITLGPLPDVQTPAGQRARLDDLGYVPPAMPGLTVPDDEPSRWAIEEFQVEHGLVADGVCGPLTQAALVGAHGH